MPSTRGVHTTRRCIPPPQSAHERRRSQGGLERCVSSIPEITLAPLAPCSDALLQGGRRESLNDLPRGLGLHHHHLAEDLPLASLRGGFRPGLQPAQAREGEHTRLPDLLSRDLGQAVNELRAHRLLKFARSGECLSNRTLRHRLACCCCLHGSHCLRDTLCAPEL